MFTEPCPVIYDIKCILDEILNITEDLSDATINALLGGTISQYNEAVCAPRIDVVGICI